MMCSQVLYRASESSMPAAQQAGVDPWSYVTISADQLQTLMGSATAGMADTSLMHVNVTPENALSG